MAEMKDVYWGPPGRPPGELSVDIVKPMMRFGSSLYISVVNSEGRWIAEADGEQFKWRLSEPHVVDDRPTLPLLDDDMLAGLHRALREGGVRTRGEAAVEHLTDCIQVRDRLLTMLESGWPR